MSGKGSRALLRSVLGRLLHPGHLYRAWRLRRAGGRVERAEADSRLHLYARVLGTDHLHYGYFDDPATPPESIALEDLRRAQDRFAEIVLEQVVDRGVPVLDVGCGMGGLLSALEERGFEAVGLTPDRRQVAYLRETRPERPVIHARFEDLELDGHRGRYGTVVTSESLQYLDLDRALPVLEALLVPGGRWVACDFFRTGGVRAPGHDWEDFRRRLGEAGWRVDHERDITAHVLPTLAFVELWGRDVLWPGIEFLVGRLKRKRPGLHHLLADAWSSLEELAGTKLGEISPERFAREQRYVLLVLARPGAGASGAGSDAHQ